ncbi:MAG TPA: hypothetical protein VI612_05670 [Candidatus Nanoarchaeia archaeon]|nr:hypothetical protein [Candidatus Nanoarchaeia archaeon]
MDLGWYRSLEWYQKTSKIELVLFICSGNTCRSPSAEYFFNKTTGWWGAKAFSRGTQVDAILAALRSRGINIQSLMIEDEVKKVIGDKTATFLSKHEATQVASGDLKGADLVLTMETSIRDQLRKDYPKYAYKIFTLKGFIDQTDDGSANLNIGNPFLPPAVRKKEGITPGKVKYYEYIQNYMRILDLIKVYVRRLVEILYLIAEEKKK